MLKYVYEDMLSMVRHLPWSFALGLPFAAILLWGINFLRRRRGKAPAAALPVIHAREVSHCQTPACS